MQCTSPSLSLGWGSSWYAKNILKSCQEPGRGVLSDTVLPCSWNIILQLLHLVLVNNHATMGLLDFDTLCISQKGWGMNSICTSALWRWSPYVSEQTCPRHCSIRLSVTLQLPSGCDGRIPKRLSWIYPKKKYARTSSYTLFTFTVGLHRSACYSSNMSGLF